MQWPSELLASVSRALDIEPEPGLNKEQVLQSLLDETVRRVVWRAEGDPARVSAALRSPYTPLGSLIASGVDGRVRTLTLHGSLWNVAVDAVYDYIEKNAVTLFEVFQDEAEPYRDLLRKE
jgi:hypothetical protein